MKHRWSPTHTTSPWDGKREYFRTQESAPRCRFCSLAVRPSHRHRDGPVLPSLRLPCATWSSCRISLAPRFQELSSSVLSPLGTLHPAVRVLRETPSLGNIRARAWRDPAGDGECVHVARRHTLRPSQPRVPLRPAPRALHLSETLSLLFAVRVCVCVRVCACVCVCRPW